MCCYACVQARTHIFANLEGVAGGRVQSQKLRSGVNSLLQTRAKHPNQGRAQQNRSTKTTKMNSRSTAVTASVSPPPISSSDSGFLLHSSLLSKIHLLLCHLSSSSLISLAASPAGCTFPQLLDPPKGQSVCRVISLGWSWTLTQSPWCIPTTNRQTPSHNGHVWPHKRTVSLWSFLINLSLLFCHLLKSCLWRWSRGRSTSWALGIRKAIDSRICADD